MKYIGVRGKISSNFGPASHCNSSPKLGICNIRAWVAGECAWAASSLYWAVECRWLVGWSYGSNSHYCRVYILLRRLLKKKKTAEQKDLKRAHFRSFRLNRNEQWVGLGALRFASVFSLCWLSARVHLSVRHMGSFILYFHWTRWSNSSYFPLGSSLHSFLCTDWHPFSDIVRHAFPRSDWTKWWQRQWQRHSYPSAMWRSGEYNWAAVLVFRLQSPI